VNLDLQQSGNVGCGTYCSYVAGRSSVVACRPMRSHLAPWTMDVMTTSLFIPLEGGFDHHGHGFVGGPPPFFPFLGATMGLLFLLLLLGTAFFLLRRGKLGPPPWLAMRHSPEAAARRILAERFAQGEISSDEFMERASILNWTPGSDTWETRRPHKKR
jgi:putative membrane protein